MTSVKNVTKGKSTNMKLKLYGKKTDFINDKIDSAYKDNARKIINCYLMGSLKSREYMLLMFIYERTIAYGKRDEVITHKNIIDGMAAKDGSLLISGLGIERRTITRTISSLLRKGVIISRPHINSRGIPSGCKYYGINLELLQELTYER